MPFTLGRDRKFGCVCLVNAGVDRALRNELLDLGHDTLAIFAPPFEIEEHWRGWLGSVKVADLAKSSLTLLSHAQSNCPAILDDENKRLVRIAMGVFYGLLLVEIFCHDNGLILSGGNAGTGVSVRQVSDLLRHLRPNGVHTRTISSVTLKRAANIAAGLRTIHVPRQYERLRNGFDALLRGFREYSGGNRLHQFVRSIEAIVKPEIGRSERLFAHRCQIFVGASWELLRELYQLRSQTEHMNSLDSVLEKYAPEDRESIARLRAYQAQLLASHIYERILTTTNLQVVFGSDVNIDNFWQSDMDKQQITWGQPIDVEELARRGLENPLP
jgi:hypothetical protein